jgi:dTDP-3-amino-3,4,6-trideoxy-alpha-D-glucose transaminase
MILANDFHRQWNDVRQDAMSAFESAGGSGRYILGREVEAFELALAAYWGKQHAIAVASGLDALEISLRVLGCKSDDKVLTTPLSAFATTLAIVKLGAIPVFCDVDEYGLIDLELVADILKRDPSIRFFVPVHLYGHPLNLHRLHALQVAYQIATVEDCAQSIGAYSCGRPTGVIGRMTATSFYPTKNLGALGDGGAILTDGEKEAHAARMLRDYGQSAKYNHEVIGFNSRLDEVQAALLRYVGLPRLNSWTDRRREIARAYVGGIQNSAVRVLGAPEHSSSCWHLFPISVQPAVKPSLLLHLRNRNVQGSEHYPVAIPDQPALQGRAFEIAGRGIERARCFCRSQVSLPIHPYLTDDEVQTVIEAVNDWSVE